MKAEIITRSGTKKEFIHAVTSFFIQELNLKNSRYTLSVFVKSGLVKESGMNGFASDFGEKQLVVFIDSKLNMEQTVRTLAHEMVHVKQMATGKLRYKTIRGKHVPFWNGKKVQVNYEDRPWEHQAWGKELILANRLWALLRVKNKY